MTSGVRQKINNEEGDEAMQKHAAREQIEMRAYELYLERGGSPGSDRDDWLRAERELEAELSERHASPATEAATGRSERSSKSEKVSKGGSAKAAGDGQGKSAPADGRRYGDVANGAAQPQVRQRRARGY